MNLIPVSNIDTAALKIYHQLRDKVFSKEGSFIADSPKVVNILLETDIEVKSILATQEYYDTFSHLLASKEELVCYVANKEMMQDIVGHKIHHNCMMHGVRPSEYALDSLDNTILMLDQITSSENIGSIARSAAALGVNSYLVPQNGPLPYARRSLRVSMGHISRLKVSVYDDIFITLRALKNLGYTIFAAEVTADSIALAKIEVPEKWVLLLGHEGRGISPEILKLCDTTVQIEMAEGVRSFNVGVAASILMYQFKNRVCI